MSNNKKTLTKEQQYQHDCVNLLGNSQFISILDSYNLPKELYNELFAAHCLTIAIQSSGIKEGSINITYCTSTANGFEDNVVGPQLNYAFFTPRYQIIQPGIHCTNCSQVIKSKQFPFPSFKYPRQFRDFLDDYWKHMKHMPDYQLSDFKDYEFKIEVRGKYLNKVLQTQHLYESIIEKTHSVHSFLNWHFLQDKIESKKCDTIKRKKI